MKLQLKKISIKNFLSVGAQPLVFEYQPGLHAIWGKVVGQDTNNGVGKSTITTDAVVFAFYGVSLRNLNLEQMVNAINQSECEVIIWFSLDDVNYRIERGLNPQYLRLINEDLPDSNQEKSKKETQKDINEKLGISFTSFVNRITLNINYSKPFFRLTAAERREIFEDMMNISIYGKMLEAARKDYNEAKHNLRVASSELKASEEALSDKIQTKKRIDDYKNSFEQQKAADLKRLTEQLDDKIKKLNDLKATVPENNFEERKEKGMVVKDKISEIINSYDTKVSLNTSEIQKIQKKLGLLKGKPACPICNSPIEHAETHITELDTEVKTLEAEITDIKAKREAASLKLADVKGKLKKIDDSSWAYNKVNQDITILESSISSVQAQIKEVEQKQIDLKHIVTDDDINQSKARVDARKSEHEEIEKQQLYADHLRDMLGDKGIKAYIIKRIVPVLNKKINEYLSIFKATYTISFDHELNETFKSRRRDVFTYNNFSAGEQKRIDLACMFALFDVAKAQNSIDCNVLILDEICDSSMCSDGIASLMTFMKTDFRKMNPDICVYVISHKPEISEDNFNTIIRLKKDNNFTKIDSIQACETVIQV
jgi:DNA repair exonuclease SbcCD ATPase subunit